MATDDIVITGIGSVSTAGPLRGLAGVTEAVATDVTRWPTRGRRRACLIPPFKPATVVPGLKARRLDRISVWAIVASCLAMEDAGIESKGIDPARVAIVAGTGLGCPGLTEAYLASVNRYGYGSSDPIIFPETLANAPAGHVARTFGFRGPNVTLSARGISGESALIQARSLLSAGEADLAIVFSGDMLTQPLYEWYEAASVLSRACFEDSKLPTPFSPESDGLFPGEGVAAMILEASTFRYVSGAKAYARILGGLSGAEPGVSATSWGENPAVTVELVRRLVDKRQLAETRLVVSSANGSPGLDRLETEIIRAVTEAADRTAVSAPKSVLGEYDASGVSRLALALGHQGIVQDTSAIFASKPSSIPLGIQAPPEHGLVLLLGTSAGGGRAAVVLEQLARSSA